MSMLRLEDPTDNRGLGWIRLTEVALQPSPGPYAKAKKAKLAQACERIFSVSSTARP